jgi:ATP/maltotriose-dependent transcriptional regulator MalT
MPVATTAGPAGAPMITDDVALHEQLNSSMQHMRDLAVESQSLAQTFAKLAATHHGADRSEMLVMQRMSEAMGTMSGEVQASLAQYKQMLENETASDSGMMKAEVQGLKGALDVMAGEIDDAMQTLRKLQSQLGQG